MSMNPTASQPGTGEWESEGGSLKPNDQPRLPDGVTAVTSIQYLVGNYSYTRLEDALAEHQRQISPERS
ncbi:MAG: hypothetical protein ACMUJI_08715 [Erythrobacter sp.]|uniref:hypothetical protein n=1 Tax=Erythrobacter sp. TaxID=1042 RepID=UPI003A8A9314